MKGWIYSLRPDRSTSGAGIVVPFLNSMQLDAKKRGGVYRVVMDYWGDTKSTAHQIQKGDFMAIYHGPKAKFRRREALECPQITLTGIVERVTQHSRDDPKNPGRHVSGFTLLIPEEVWQVFRMGGLKEKKPNMGIFRDLKPWGGQFAFKEISQSQMERIQQWIRETYEEDQMW